MQSLALAKTPKIAPAKEGNTQIEKFISLIQEGIAAWEKAGRLLVIEIEKDEGFFRAVRISHPDISMDMLLTFERIGRNQIYAPLLADSSAGARALLECPFEVQKKYATGSVQVLISAKGGNLVTTGKKISELSRPEVKQVFGRKGGSVLTPDEQVFHLPEKREPKNLNLNSAAVVLEKPVHVGYYKLECDGKGNVKVTPTVHDPSAQYVRIIPKGGVGSDFHTTVLLFYRTK